MLAPSVTPKRSTDGPNNPGIRLYKFDKHTGQVRDVHFFVQIFYYEYITKKQSDVNP